MKRQPDNVPLPFVFVNMAMTADGKIATANRAVSSFGSARDREHLLELRARADAVMAGARTVDLNPVNMGPGPARYRRLRLRNGLREYNLRVIVSGSASIDPEAEVFKNRFSPIIVLATERAPQGRLKLLGNVADEVRICGRREIDFELALRWLGKKWNVRRLLCEGGGEVNDALFRAGLVNELHLTVCPKIFGGRNAPTICDGRGFSKLAEARPMTLASMKRVGDELFLRFLKSQPVLHSLPPRPHSPHPGKEGIGREQHIHAHAAKAAPDEMFVCSSMAISGSRFERTRMPGEN